MTIIIPSGSKATVFSKDAEVLEEVSKIAKVPVRVGNEFVKSSVCVPMKFIPKVWQIIFSKRKE